MSTTTEKQFDQGLVGTIVAETAMSFIDGEQGVLEYVGIDIDSLARNSTFEETTFLLWNRRLPSSAELGAFEAELRAEYAVPEGILDMIRAMPADAPPMHAVQTLVAALSLFDSEALELAMRRRSRPDAASPQLLCTRPRLPTHPVARNVHAILEAPILLQFAVAGEGAGGPHYSEHPIGSQ